MFGWELPPYNSGGLGVACQGLSDALSHEDLDLLFVLPKRLDMGENGFKVLYADNSIQVTAISSLLTPYITPGEYSHLHKKVGLYGQNLFEEVKRFAQKAKEVIENEDFDIIHAHDWLAFEAGIQAKKISGKPLVVHVHSTEFDRTGGNGVNKQVFQIEKKGMEKADKIIAVSNFTKKIIEDKYGINPKKIQVIHNRINADEYEEKDSANEQIFSVKKDGKKIVLFVGRITLKKDLNIFSKLHIEF